MATAHLLNVWRDKKSKAVEPGDVLVRFEPAEEEDEELTPEEQALIDDELVRQMTQPR